MNHRNEFVGTDAQGRKQTKRKPEHRHASLAKQNRTKSAKTSKKR